jgi:small subunit ribosomal protein S4
MGAVRQNEDEFDFPKEVGLARYTESVCRLCRRENLKLFLKGERCYTDKCAIERRNYPPGQHGQKRPKFSEYSIQLREKQKVKRMYGLMENQFRRTFARASREKGITGEALLVLLERRLDNVVYRLGFASSRAEGRMLVRQGHILVNGKRVNIPSYGVRAGDDVSVKEESRQMARVLTAMEGAQRRGVPEWAEVNRDTFSGRIRLMPARSDITMPINEKLIVELYSK